MHTRKTIQRENSSGRSGFTLVELVIVVAISGILAAIAIPNLLRNYPTYQARGAARNLMANLQQARMEAIRTNANVVIEITPGIFSAAGRVGSYRAFVDDGAGGVGAKNNMLDVGERILFTVPIPDRVSLTGLVGFTPAADPGAAAGTRFTRYNARGLLSAVADVTLGSTTITYTVALSNAGYIRLGVN